MRIYQQIISVFLTIAVVNAPLYAQVPIYRPTPAKPDMQKQFDSIKEEHGLNTDYTEKKHTVTRSKKEENAVETTAAYVESHRKEIAGDLTRRYWPQRQTLLEALQIHGKAIDLKVVDVDYLDPCLLYEPVIMWEDADHSGGVVWVGIAYDLKKDQVVKSGVIDKKLLSATELSRFTSGQTPPEPKKEDSRWMPSNETINKGFQAAIAIGAAWVIKKIWGDDAAPIETPAPAR
jgi:hypothetical protein